jgi:hypothetical protein
MLKPAALQQLRNDAYRLHKTGELAKAAALYEAHTQQDKSNSDVIGLFAMCLFQLGRTVKAFEQWRYVLSLSAPVPTQWRNANNFFAAILSGKGADHALDVNAIPIKSWQSKTQPTIDDVIIAISLAHALEKLGRSDEIISVFSPFVADLNLSLPVSLTFLRWALEADYVGLIEAVDLARLTEESNKTPDATLLLSAYYFKCHDETSSQKFAFDVAQKTPIYITPKLAGQKYTVGVLNRPTPTVRRAVDVAQFHFGENTPAGLVNRFSNDFRFVSVFPFHIGANEIQHLEPQPQFFINNWATAEILATPGTLQHLVEFSSALGVPVLNRPEAVVKTTRQQVSETLQGIDGLLVPKVLRVYNSNDSFVATALLLEREIGFPLILREPFQQMGHHAIKVSDSQQLFAALQTFPFTQIYAIQFIDNPVTTGIYRKIRAAIVGDEIFISHVLYRGHWNVHRERNDVVRKQLEEHPLTIGFADKITNDPASVLSQLAMTSLQTIRKRIDLDLFGIDFDVMQDGRLLFFEANAAMHISFADKYGHADVRKRMLVGLHRLFEQSVARSP